jgi:hypothetical protein
VVNASVARNCDYASRHGDTGKRGNGDTEIIPSFRKSRLRRDYPESRDPDDQKL